MLLRLLLLMTIVPAIELYLLMQLAEVMGIMETVLLIVVTGTVDLQARVQQGLELAVTRFGIEGEGVC